MSIFKPESLNGYPIPHYESISELKRLIVKPGPEAWAAIMALAYKIEPEALTTLVKLTSSKAWYFRRSAVEAIGIHPFGHTKAEAVCRLLSDSSTYVIRTAIETAQKLMITQAHDQILSYVNSADSLTRVTALIAMEDLWRPEDFPQVFERYSNDPIPEVRKQAAFTIAKNIDEKNWSLVFNSWLHDEIPRHRVWACEIAAIFGNKELIPLIEKMQDDTDGHVRATVNKTITKLKTV